MPDKRCTSLIKTEAGPLSNDEFIRLCRERCHLSIVNTSAGAWLDCALQRLEATAARIAELEGVVEKQETYIAELRELVPYYPKTADGADMLQCGTLWVVDPTNRKVKHTTTSNSFGAYVHLENPNSNLDRVECVPPCRCYSTEQAARDAVKGGE